MNESRISNCGCSKILTATIYLQTSKNKVHKNAMSIQFSALMIGQPCVLKIALFLVRSQRKFIDSAVDKFLIPNKN